jgi:subfamily B ATP-binding cassette protein HlyB/CyaB
MHTLLTSLLRRSRLPRIESGIPLHFSQLHLVWALGSMSALHQRAFDSNTLMRELPSECNEATLLSAARGLGFLVKRARLKIDHLGRAPLPMLAACGVDPSRLVLVTEVTSQHVVYFEPGTNQAVEVGLAAFSSQFSGRCWLFSPEVSAPADPDAVRSRSATFGFRWFLPELLRHKKVWRDVLLASLGLQIVSLTTPLFTQAIIDKVVVHRTQSTLIAIGLAMALFVLFGALLSWSRQYMVLHTGNRVDAVLGAAVWDHLLKLSPRYFERRSTGVVAARLHAVETIREFISGAAVSVVLDLPFLVICLAVMLTYSVTLTAIAVSILLVIAGASAIMAPIFQRQLNEQFMLGARNQAFLTEHIAGFETVKTMQMEPQLRHRYSGYVATLLASAFRTKQVANGYNSFANALGQVMTLAILLVGAWTVMNEPNFTVGMLVAFQMFSGKLSDPVLRIVGLWTQFQQANMSVQRLGDLLNAPAEPYSLIPQRLNDGQGKVEVTGLGFRYADDRPLLYTNLEFTLEPGSTIAVMGPSGSGKSTLAKLLLGFYQPTHGTIRIDGIDIRSLSANELRAYFGVVPQETMLFTGSIFENLKAGNAGATLEQVADAARMAGIHEVIEALPQGYQTEIGERGAGLSGGQKQRIAIARALLKRPRILIFDEATSALDAETAEAFAKTINELRGHVTMLFITHALPASLRLDGVLQIKRDGAHQLQLVSAAATHNAG